MTSHRFGVPVVVLVVLAALLVPTPAGAVIFKGSVTELPFPDHDINEFLDEKFSGDLGTAVFTRDPAALTSDPGPNAGITTVLNLDTGQQRAIEPARGATGQIAVQLDMDGSHLLMAAGWEGIDAGDADDGAIDLFLIDLETEEITTITADLAGNSFVAVGMDRTGDTVLFQSGTEVAQLHVWEAGVVSNVPINGTLESAAPLQLSGDGTKVLYTTTAGADLTWHVQDLTTGAEVTSPAPAVFSASMSDDGGVVAGVDTRSAAASASSRIWLTQVWRTQSGEVDRFVAGSEGSVTQLTADGSTLIGSSASSLPRYGGGSLWQLDTTTGATASILFTSGRVRGLSAIAADGERLIYRAVPTALGQLPVTAEFIESRGADELDRFFEIDLTEPASSIPGYAGTLDDQLHRLYLAFFDRRADQSGLAHWRRVRANGDSLFDITRQFFPAGEFGETYGDIDDDDDAFIDLVYANVLDRSPDAAGRSFWLDQLGAGRDRGSVIVLFSESPEFIERTGTQPPETTLAAAVRRLYAGYFGRDADTAGLRFWAEQAEQGVPLETISEAFLASQEFSDIYETSALLDGLVNDADSIAIIGFGNTIGTVDEDEVSRLSVAVQDGTISLGQVMVSITSTPEYVILTSSTPPGG